jgi:hypothetical protein
MALSLNMDKYVYIIENSDINLMNARQFWFKVYLNPIVKDQNINSPTRMKGKL